MDFAITQALRPWLISQCLEVLQPAVGVSRYLGSTIKEREYSFRYDFTASYPENGASE
jgi:hypothetical protein